jgi:hypothetical protein
VAVDTPRNPFEISPADFPQLPRYVLHLLSSTALTHRLVRRGWRLGQPANGHHVALYRHRGEALSLLSREITSISRQNRLAILSGVLAFTLAEVCGDQGGIYHPSSHRLAAAWLFKKLSQAS